MQTSITEEMRFRQMFENPRIKILNDKLSIFLKILFYIIKYD